MIDLYAIGPKFPKLQESGKLNHVPHDKVKFLEAAFAEDIGDRRFVPHIQLHEYEAYLFCDPSCLLTFYPSCSKGVKELKKIADSYATPELIDDGDHTAPSKRIALHFPGYEGAKPTVGVQAARSVGLKLIRSKWPHFDGWIKRLEGLGQLP
jgi:hypothetical protein